MTQINPTPNCTSIYGAPMGRPSYGHDCAPTSKLTLRRIRLNSGGYDSGGAYWGIGQPLYWYCAESGTEEISNFMRANNREHAKSRVLAKYPQARFYR